MDAGEHPATSPVTSLAGRVALVTGGGRGIGRATALALAKRGAAVTVLARTAHEVEETVAAISAEGGPARGLVGDIREVAQHVARIERDLGPIAILVNNAAAVTPVAPLWRTDADEWLECLMINLYGPYLAARAVLPGMLARGWGRIVNVSSGAGRTAVSGGSAYCSSKAGLDHLTRVLALELDGTGVTANALYPGGVDTAMQARLRAVPVEDFGPANAARFQRSYAEGRLRPPTVPAALITWVVAETGPEVNGQVFDLNDPATWRLAGLDLGETA